MDEKLEPMGLPVIPMTKEYMSHPKFSTYAELIHPSFDGSSNYSPLEIKKKVHN